MSWPSVRLRTGSTRKVYDRALTVLGEADKLNRAATERRRSQELYRFQDRRDVKW